MHFAVRSLSPAQISSQRVPFSLGGLHDSAIIVAQRRRTMLHRSTEVGFGHIEALSSLLHEKKVARRIFACRSRTVTHRSRGLGLNGMRAILNWRSLSRHELGWIEGRN